MNWKGADSPPWLRRGAAKRRGGWFKKINLLDQHHPGASRHPSSSEEGSVLPCQLIHTFYNPAYSLDSRRRRGEGTAPKVRPYSTGKSTFIVTTTSPGVVPSIYGLYSHCRTACRAASCKRGWPLTTRADFTFPSTPITASTATGPRTPAILASSG